MSTKKKTIQKQSTKRMNSNVIIPSEENKKLLKSYDEQLNTARTGIEKIAKDYNNFVTGINGLKSALLNGILNGKEASKDSLWHLDENYNLSEMTKKEYDALLQQKQSVETVLEKSN